MLSTYSFYLPSLEKAKNFIIMPNAKFKKCINDKFPSLFEGGGSFPDFFLSILPLIDGIFGGVRW